MNKKLIALFVAGMTAGVTGCFDSSSSSSTPASTSTSGKAADGYLFGMFCYADVNGNDKFDNGTDLAASELTDTEGNYTIRNDDGSNPLICRSTDQSKDQSNGNAYLGQLSAPAGAQNVTPVTSLWKELGDADKVRTALGLSADQSLDADPVGDPNFQKVAVKLNQTIKSITDFISEQADFAETQKAEKQAVFKLAMKALASAINDVENPAEITDITDPDSTGYSDLIKSVVDKTTNSVTNGKISTNDEDDATALVEGLTSIIKDIENATENFETAASNKEDSVTIDPKTSFTPDPDLGGNVDNSEPALDPQPEVSGGFTGLGESCKLDNETTGVWSGATGSYFCQTPTGNYYQ